MNSSSRCGLLMMLLLALFIQGAFGITVDTTSGDATGTVGSATEFKAPSDSAINTAIVFGSGSKLSQTISGEGSLNQTHSASNKAGAQVTIEASWSDSKSYTYSYNIYPGEGTGFSSPYVMAGEALDVDDAVNLSAYAEAMSSEGDYAISQVEAGNGSLGGYENSARADKFSASTTQTASYARLEAGAVNEDGEGGIAGFYSEAFCSGESGYSERYIESYDPNGTGGYSDFIGYSDSAKASNSKISASQSIKSVSGSWIQWGTSAVNEEGDSSVTDNGFGSGLLTDYMATQTVLPRMVSTSQSLVSLGATGYPGPYGLGFELMGTASDDSGDSATSSFAAGSMDEAAQASLNGYTQSQSAKKAGVSASQRFSSASGKAFDASTESSNAESDSSNVGLGITYGYASKYSDSASATKSSTEVSASFKGEGRLVDLRSHAENAKPAEEGLGEPVNFGGADFEYQAKNNLAASIKSTASLSKGVRITPTLPSGTKTAILLEPYSTFAVQSGGVDTIYTAFPALANSSYAVTRYVDSAASKDKFSGLDKYNVAMVISHMDSVSIGLSTLPNEVKASELRYSRPQSKSFAIMAGCESFGGYPTPSKLANAIGKANLRAGYGASVDVPWGQDYMGELFNQMSAGKTAAEANDYIWNTYRYTWAADHKISPDDPGLCKLLFYGNSGFTL